ncbi:SDR family NAD(P)-dependent oxidoreductase [Halomonas sp. HAL1]|uniref:SDR family NAD(P)-dependent oxidoreductase n=1 Tax=Halomonas sp. HAL1 TaxID=550984 RepID=UPI00022D31CD|nr:SDR family oxidoreductase [Halomonas sp. HAL1]EHA16480.1 short-chain dehydrogenase/reductase SDR [Halomonas sp. HAL1]WKV92690.1 SDR family oxidoreductase [Halomonas sp. HAL1]
MSSKNKVAIVTGAASGIGKSTASFLADKGMSVIAIDRDENGLMLLRNSSADKIYTLESDLTDTDLEIKVAEALHVIGGELSILVNNAGMGGGDSVLSTSDESLRNFLEINIVSLFRLSRLAITEMKKQSHGAIVNVASIYAEVGATSSSAYSSSKGAVASLTRQMATDYGPSGIRVNAVAPGLIETPLTAERIRTERWRKQIFVEQSPLRRVGQSDEVARAIVFLASEDASFINGEILRVDGGWGMGRYPRPEEEL